MTDSRVTCPHCGQLVTPNESDTEAGTLLVCPQCYKLIGRKE